ncbi:MAG: hypothetical protein K8S87_07125 [Planctomycetes bacterium]|nr:hypothetical protein [Planctomycetota bacterium]
MKKIMLMLILTAAMFALGCSSVSKGYMLEAQIHPLTLDEIAEMKKNMTEEIDRDLYRCDVVIKEITYDGDETTEITISAPRITFFDGQKAAVSVADEKSGDDVFAEVVVNDEKNDGYSNIDVHVKEKGKTLSHSKFKFKLK